MTEAPTGPTLVDDLVVGDELFAPARWEIVTAVSQPTDEHVVRVHAMPVGLSPGLLEFESGTRIHSHRPRAVAAHMSPRGLPGNRDPHPTWCLAEDCTVTAEGGAHRSFSHPVPIGVGGPHKGEVFLECGGTTTLLTLELRRDPAVSVALGMDADPGVFVFSLDQARLLHRAVGRLLAAASSRPRQQPATPATQPMTASSARGS